MGLAYGATDEGSSGGARRVGVVIDEKGQVLIYEPKVNARSWPAEVVTQL